MGRQLRNILSAAACALLLLASCNRIVTPEQEKEEVVIKAPAMAISQSLIGSFSARFTCIVSNTDRIFLQGGFYYSLSPDMKDSQRLPGIIAKNEITVMATDLQSDTTYYYQAYLIDRYGTETSETFSFESAKFDVAETDFNIDYTGGDIQVAVTTNEGFAINPGNADWLKSDAETKANVQTTHVIHVAMNTTYRDRHADIIIQSPDGYFKKAYTLTQKASPLIVEDDALNSYLLSHFDKDENGRLDYEEFESIDSLDLDSRQIMSLSGIEVLENLTYLKYSGEGPEKGVLASINLSFYPKLLHLDLHANNLDGIDISGNSYLTYLDVSSNNISEINLSKSQVIDTLMVSGNQLSEIDLTKNPALAYLNCSNNRLSALNGGISQSLRHLECNDNPMTAIDVRINSNLEYLDCSNCALESINLMNNKNLEALICPSNNISSLYLRKNHNLARLDCSRNPVEGLEPKYNPDLNYLDCSSTNLKLLDVSGNPYLVYLNCSNTGLETIDISTNKALRDVYCVCDGMHTMYVDRSVAIDGITAGRSDEHVSPSTTIREHKDAIRIVDAQFLAYLLKYYDIDKNGEISIDEGSKITSINVSGYAVHDLTGIEYMTSLKYLKCSGTTDTDGSTHGMITGLDLSGNPHLQQLICDGNAIASLTLEHNQELRTLWCYNNRLTALDLSSNTALEDLNCQGNLITDLDLSKNSKLTSLDCSPMNDAQGNNILKSIALSRQDIKFVTSSAYPRNVSNVPSATTILTSDFKSPFMFNYNARDYDSATMTIPNHQTASWRSDLTLSSGPAGISSNFLFFSLSRRAFRSFQFNNASENPFNRDSKNNTLTIIFKVRNISPLRKDILSNGTNFKLNGGTQSTNYFYLQDSRGFQEGCADLSVQYAPEIIAVRATSKGMVYLQSFTWKTTGTARACSWGPYSNALTIFGDSPEGTSYWSGYFYWIYLSLDELSDDEIQMVIDFNEKSK